MNNTGCELLGNNTIDSHLSLLSPAGRLMSKVRVTIVSLGVAARHPTISHFHPATIIM